MNHPKLVIFGYSEAAMYLHGTPKPNVTAIISIHGAREYGVEAVVPNRLDLMFDDVEVAKTGDLLALQRAFSRRRSSEQNGLIEVAPALSDATAIIRFAETLRDAGGILLTHCGAGMSRATAAALICLSVWRGPGTEDDCVNAVFQLRRAVPHMGLVRFADQALGRDGKLVSALAGGVGAHDPPTGKAGEEKEARGDVNGLRPRVFFCGPVSSFATPYLLLRPRIVFSARITFLVNIGVYPSECRNRRWKCDIIPP